MKTTIYPLLIGLILCFGCKNASEMETETAESFRNPKTVGTLPDGRVVQMVTVIGKDTCYDHYIYFVGNTATLNTRFHVGKTSYQRVVVMIDGKTNFVGDIESK